MINSHPPKSKIQKVKQTIFWIKWNKHKVKKRCPGSCNNDLVLLFCGSEFFSLSFRKSCRKIRIHDMVVDFIAKVLLQFCCSWLIALVELAKASFGTNQCKILILSLSKYLVMCPLVSSRIFKKSIWLKSN